MDWNIIELHFERMVKLAERGLRLAKAKDRLESREVLDTLDTLVYETMDEYDAIEEE